MELYDNWWEEKRSAYLYTILAENEDNILHKKLFTDLHKAALKQADMWELKIEHQGLPAPKPFKPDSRTRIVAQLVRWFGSERLHTILSAMKIRGMSVFTHYH